MLMDETEKRDDEKIEIEKRDARSDIPFHVPRGRNRDVFHASHTTHYSLAPILLDRFLRFMLR